MRKAPCRCSRIIESACVEVGFAGRDMEDAVDPRRPAATRA